MERYVIHVTKLCNCDCHYCYETDKTSIYSWDEVKQLIDNIVLFNKDKAFDIEFLGGEPMMAFDLIVKSVEYLESMKNIEVPSYAITTNGTIVHKELIDFMKKYDKVRWAASMDGNKWMNQFRVLKESRKNTHDIVLENYKKLANEVDVRRLGVHIVSHPYNIALLSKGIDHLYKNGVRSIVVGTVESTFAIDDQYCNRFISELDIVSTKICNGEYPGLFVNELESLKSDQDVRHYVKDPATGKTIAESYGRTNNDITDSDIYNAYGCEELDDIGKMINYIRKEVYINHQNKLKNTYR